MTDFSNTRGGGVLLKTKGKNYFSELAKKGAEKRREAMKLWDKMHPEEAINKRIKEREERRQNSNMRIANNLRGRLRLALKSQKTQKNNSTLLYIGCTKEFLREYLQSLFQENMSWENYGKWHIDHIKPISLFDLTKEEEIYKAMHYTNLQPLWAKDNHKKSTKYINCG